MKNATFKPFPYLAPVFRVDYSVMEFDEGYEHYDNSWLTANPSGLMNTVQRAAELWLSPDNWTTDNFTWRQTKSSKAVYTEDSNSMFFLHASARLVNVPFIRRGFRKVDLHTISENLSIPGE